MTCRVEGLREACRRGPGGPQAVVLAGVALGYGGRMNLRSIRRGAWLVTSLGLLVAACGGSDETAVGGGGAGATGGGGAGGAGGRGAMGGGGASCGPDDGGPDEVLGPGADPAAGVFSLDEALDGLPQGPGPLRAVVRTELGDITCTLAADKAPNGVANFVGLARGRRPWRDPSMAQWVRRRFYDGLTFHRIIDDFMAQGGDPLGTGFGGPGYSFADEISDLVHQPGTLAYANAGPDTNGSQFYITEIATDWLDGGYTILGYCEPLAVVQALAAVPTNANDHPLTPVHMLSVDVTRCAP